MKFPKTLIIPGIALTLFILIFVVIVGFKPHHLISLVFVVLIIYISNKFRID